jgi:hypothetical protein
MGSFLNAEYVSSLLPKSLLLAAPIGGYIFPHDDYTGPNASTIEALGCSMDAFRKYVKLFSPALPLSCISRVSQQDRPFCLSPVVALPFSKVTTLVIESQIDTVVMGGFSGVPHLPMQDQPPEALAYIDNFRNRSVHAIEAVASMPSTGWFDVDCFMHTGFTPTNPVLENTNYLQAMSQMLKAMQSPGADPVRIIDLSKGLNVNPTCPQKGIVPV